MGLAFVFPVGLQDESVIKAYELVDQHAFCFYKLFCHFTGRSIPIEGYTKLIGLL